MERPTTFAAASAAAGVFIDGGFARTASAEADIGIRAHQLLGQRYDTMLALARYLDETAQGARRRADEEGRVGSVSEAGFASTIRSLAVSTRDLHRTMCDRQATSVELPAQVLELTQRVRRLNGQVRWAQALASTYDDWNAMADVLERMTLLLAGHDVAVPTAYLQTALSGPSLLRLRQLASDLEVSARRAQDKATRAVTDHPERGEQFLGALRHFADQSRDLHVQATTGALDAERLGPLVDDALDEAREVDRRLRDASVFTEVWADSARTITLLQRMASLVRS
jgi:hypothetical protein